MLIDLSGSWFCKIPGQEGPVRLPGTLDESGVGFPDDPARQWKAEEVQRIGFYRPGDPIVTRLTRKHTFEGQAVLSRVVDWKKPEGMRVFLEVERARHLRLFVGDAEAPLSVEAIPQLSTEAPLGTEAPLVRPTSLSSPWCFEVTNLVTGHDRLTFLSDNSYPGWPREAIVYASAASDETQTNWNGLLGAIQLRLEKPVFISRVKVYPYAGQSDAACGPKDSSPAQPDTASRSHSSEPSQPDPAIEADGAAPWVLDVSIELDSAVPWQGRLRISSEVLEEDAFLSVETAQGLQGPQHEKASLPVETAPVRQCFQLRNLKVRPEAARWDLEEGSLHTLTVSAEGLEPRCVSFGLRVFEARDGHFVLNGRRIFLRSEANCAVFPETGYCPMEVSAWKDILLRYRSYGVNCLRFHSHCPPEAAFVAADELGLLMQPELSHWDPEHAFASAEAKAYYQAELFSILDVLANHPSFVMLTFGNELHADAKGHAFMDGLLRLARETDGTRLYANGSNPHYGALGPDPHSDFYTSSDDRGRCLRLTSAGPSGWLNRQIPDPRRNFDAAMAELRKTSDQPVFSFEVGQYEVLPDFEEISLYQGVTSPENLKHIRRKVAEKGLEKDWCRRIEATGESALLCYRAEVLAALNTEGFSGISLLGLQDFPGQGTALVGMMNAHLQPKPFAFAQPERFRAFFRDVLPLPLPEKYTWTCGETLTVSLRVANYGKRPLSGVPVWTLQSEHISLRGELPPAGSQVGEEIFLRGELPPAKAPAGSLTDLGDLHLPLPALEKPAKLTLTLSLDGTTGSSPLWVYPDVQPVCPPAVYECRKLDEAAIRVLRSGGAVYLAPDSTPQALPHSVQAQFSPDFWSVCTFPEQAGCMGQLIDAAHPVFRSFPTESWSNWQWWPMAGQRAMILSEPIDCIIAEMDSYAFLRPMAKLFECRCEGGRLMVSSMGLHQLAQYPESRTLQKSIYDYLASADFQPRQTLPLSWIETLLSP